MKILFISAEPARSAQAAATHITEIVDGLTRAGYEIVTCVPVTNVSYHASSLFARLLDYFRFWMCSVRKLHGCDLVYARAHPANVPIILLARIVGKKVLQEVNGSYTDVTITHRWLRAFTPLIRFLYIVQYRSATALITVTDGLVAWLREQAPGIPTYCIPNGANCGVFYPRVSGTRPIQPDYAIFFGSLTLWHGIETILAAVRDPAWPSELHLVIVGDGQLKARVSQESGRNALIHVLPPLSQEALAEYVSSAKVGLVPINSVGSRGRLGLSPIKLYEMLACGIPVIVTDFPGQRELVRSLDAGVVIPPDDPSALACAVSALNERPPNSQEMMRVAGRIAAEHSWSVRVKQIERVIVRHAAIPS